MPGEFIDVAEETGDIVPMGRGSCAKSCRQTREWQLRLGLPSLQVSVNLSARQFQRAGPRRVDPAGHRGHRAAAVEPRSSRSPRAASCSGPPARSAGSAELRALGVHLAIDDFGTGYSSLSYLERFPVDILKIDRSFIASVTASGERPAIAQAIVELGRTLGLRVVAEGIEEPDQADWLVEPRLPAGPGLPVLAAARRRRDGDVPRGATRPGASRRATSPSATSRRRSRGRDAAGPAPRDFGSSRANSRRGPGRQNGFSTINQTSTANPTMPIPASASGRRVSRIRASSSFETGAGGGSPFLSFIDGSPTALRTVA